MTDASAGPDLLDEPPPPLPILAGDARARRGTEDGNADTIRRILGPGIIRRRFHNDSADGIFFGLFAMVGFIFAAFARPLGASPLYAELFTVAILVGYAVAATMLKSFRAHPDRLGDNCYYMGFIFTLTALSSALVSVSLQSGDGRSEMLDGLIGSFGIALASTIFGIILRVIFMQFRREVEDVEQAIRSELQEAARTLKDHLGEAVGDLENFRLRTRQVMEEQFDSQISGFAATSEILSQHLRATGAVHVAAAERLTSGSEEAAAKLALAAEGMTAQVQAAGTTQSEVAERLTQNAERVVGEVSRLVERIDQIEVPSDLLTRQVEDARKRISALAAALESVVAADAGRQVAVEQAAGTLNQLLSRMSDLRAFETIETSAARMGPVIESATGALEDLGSRMAGQADAFTRLVARAEADSEAMSRARASLEADLAESTSALHKLQGTLADVAENLVRQLSGS